LAIPLADPIHAPGNELADTTYRYGGTQGGARDPHHGVDLSNAFGTPVHAAADGVVVFAGSDAQVPVAQWSNFYGNAVVIQHDLPGMPEPVYTLYGHLSTVEAAVGETVSAETRSAGGASGVALGSHLHLKCALAQMTMTRLRTPELWLVPRAPCNSPPNSWRERGRNAGGARGG
jgi:murein DD-endopeptidase MepM/ murein hydrolase activator NlpD